MTELRWTLLGIGLAIVGLIYLWGRRSTDRDDDIAVTRRPPIIGDSEPVGGTAPRETAIDAANIEPVYVDEPAVTAAESPPEPPAEKPAPPPPADKVVILHLVPASDEELDAAETVAAIRAEGLRFGAFDIFHRYAEEGNPTPDSQPLFSVANMLKPGSFDLEKTRDGTLKGISMFVQLPGPPDPLAAFADMLATGRRLAVTLEGQLVDSQGCAVSRQRASHMREDIINHLHSAKIASEQEAQSEA